MRALGVALVLLLAQPVAAGTRIESETRWRDGESPRLVRAVLRVAGDRMRLDPEDGRASAIYRPDRELAWWLDHRERSYREVDRATVAALASGRQRANEWLRDGAAVLSPERRAALERLFDSALGPVSAPSPVRWRRTGRREVVRGTACEERELLQGDERFAVVCVADYAAIGLDAGAREAFRSLAAFLRESLAALAPNAVRQQALDAVDGFDRLEGFPLRVRAMPRGAPASETVVTKIARERVDPTVFELPPGYRLERLPGGFAGAESDGSPARVD